MNIREFIEASARAVAAEVLKLKHTLALWLVLIAPGVVVALISVQWLLQTRSPVPPSNLAADNWALYCSAVLSIWTFLMLPLYLTLQAALMAGLEHQERHWKRLLCLPMPRSSYYLAKLFVVAALVVLAMASLVLLLIPLGGVLVSLRADIDMAGWPDFSKLISQSGKILLCTMLLLALANFIALRWRSFTVAVSIGMSATVMGFIIGQSPRFGPWFPWTMPIQPLTKNPDLTAVYACSAIGFLLLTVLSCLEFERREVTD